MEKPKYDIRKGTAALTTARLWIIASICAFQYWLFNITMEAFNYGKENIVLVTSIISFACFFLSLFILIKGEKYKS